MQATYSALIMVCINNEQLERAGEVYQLTVKSGLHPDIHAYNALINAYGCDFQVGSALLVYPQTVHNHLLVAGTHTGHFRWSWGACGVFSLSLGITPFGISCCAKHSVLVAC